MQVQSLSLKNFRNYPEQELTFSPGQNVFIGKNGQGKTNLLEALFFLSHSRSNRTSTDRELMLQGAPYAKVSAWVGHHHFESSNHIEAQMTLGEGDRLKTLFKLNGSALKSRSQVLGTLPTVSFFLPDLLLLRGTPEDRRRWLDTAAIQYDKRHFNHLSEFQKVRLQKSRLLKEPPERISAENLAVWNQQFARTGARLMASRIHYLSLIQDLAPVRYLELSGTSELLTVSYHAAALEHHDPSAVLTEEVLEVALTERLAERQAEELRRGTCLVGPHRDDIRFGLAGLDACSYGSQGQQRSIVLALKLTELTLLTHKLGEFPVLLLDDVMAELDPHRQHFLMDRIDPGIQVFLTTTHLDQSLTPLLEPRGESRPIALYTVEAGSVRLERSDTLSKEIHSP